MTSYINQTKLKALAREKGRRTSPQFLRFFNLFVREKFVAACAVHNGGKKTLDLAVATHAGCAPRGDA